MKKRYTIYYKNEQFSSDNKESLVSSLIKFKGLKKEEALEYVNKFTRETKSQTISSNLKLKQPNRFKKKSLQEIVNGGLALVKTSLGITVNQEEINRRAGICSSCPLKSEVTGCGACGFSKKVSGFVNNFKKSINYGFTVPNGLSSNYCSVCDCSLVVMLPSSMSSFKETEEKNNERPDHCWIKKASDNYIE